MAIRQTIHVLKNSNIVNRPLPSSLLAGEPIVNTADGIVFFSGITTSTTEWTPAGPGGSANFFEVGSNLYDLRLRNQITKYQGQTGSGLVGKFLSGTTSGFVLADISSIQGIDTYVTGSSLTAASNNSNTQSSQLTYNVTPSGGPYSISTQNTFTTGGTWNSGTASIDFKRNDGATYSVNLSGIDVNDTYVTGFTYNTTNNSLTISQNQGEPNLTVYISSVSGLTFNNLTAGRVVYVGTGGLLKDESGFEYNDSTNLLTVGNINVQNSSGTTANIGQGGLVIGSGGSIATPGIGDLTVHGNLNVFGSQTIIGTNELYVEDPQITLNYNPTGNTSVTSVSSGIKIQDGNGVVSGNTYFTIGTMQNLIGIVVGQTPSVSEYTGLTGYSNRGWVTQLNDIVIRNNNLNEGSPNGVRVLAEFDVLDGGSY
jgi:hypothetical protein